jgi:hypothetical protein
MIANEGIDNFLASSFTMRELELVEYELLQCLLGIAHLTSHPARAQSSCVDGRDNFSIIDIAEFILLRTGLDRL